MKVIVIGAGIAGLGAGIALRQIGCKVEIYEQQLEMRPASAAIVLWPNGVKCLNRLGLGRQITRLGAALESVAFADGVSGETLTRFGLQRLVHEVGQRPCTIARADLQAMLMEQFGRADVHLGAQLVHLDEDDDGRLVHAHFEDGRAASGDLLIGADGTHSLVRKHLLGQRLERRYAGYVNWNGLVEADVDLAPAHQWTTWVADGKRVSTLPVSGHRFQFSFDVPLFKGLAHDKSTLRADLHRHFARWVAPVQGLIERLDPASTNRVEIHDIEPFPTLAQGRVALAGDAGHSATPDLSQGACLALEDAIQLATALQTNTLGAQDSLRRYQDKRRARVTDLVLKARRRSDLVHGWDPAATQRWYEELRAESGEGIWRSIAADVAGGPLG